MPVEFEDDIARAWLQDGIVRFHYKPKVIVDLEIQKRHIEYRKQLCAGIVRPMLSDINGGQYWTVDARKYAFSNWDYISAVAFVWSNSFVHSTIINYVFRFYSKKIPMKGFNSEKKALDWLEKFKSTESRDFLIQ
jgi:hypothetical protein